MRLNTAYWRRKKKGDKEVGDKNRGADLKKASPERPGAGEAVEVPIEAKGQVLLLETGRRGGERRWREDE